VSGIENEIYNVHGLQGIGSQHAKTDEHARTWSKQVAETVPLQGQFPCIESREWTNQANEVNDGFVVG
jgi:hypothetical protein